VFRHLKLHKMQVVDIPKFANMGTRRHGQGGTCPILGMLWSAFCAANVV